MLVLGLHIRDSLNAGDRASCPLDYLTIPGCDVVVADMRTPPRLQPDVVIYGGGSIVTSPDFRRWPDSLMVGWGVGHHERVKPWAEAVRTAHLNAAAVCDLYFPRDDTGEEFERVPCASCLHSVFDEVFAPPRHDVVRYSAARRVEVSEPDGTPHMSNEDGEIVDAVRFLATGRTVVTSSYHGAYWARLLGRDVRLVSWGSKFDDIPNISLAEARRVNHQAHRKLVERIRHR